MSKFFVIKRDQLPEKLCPKEYVIGDISFITEIKYAERVKPRGNLIKASYLKTIMEEVCRKYNNDPFLAWSKFKYHEYEGVPYNSEEELDKILLKMTEKDYPITIENYYRTKIRNRPINIHVIYFTAPMKFASLFAREGIDQIINATEIDDILKMKRFKTENKLIPAETGSTKMATIKANEAMPTSVAMSTPEEVTVTKKSANGTTVSHIENEDASSPYESVDIIGKKAEPTNLEQNKTVSFVPKEKELTGPKKPVKKVSKKK